MSHGVSWYLMMSHDISWCLMVGLFCFLQKKQRGFEQKCSGYEQQLKEAREQAEVNYCLLMAHYKIIPTGKLLSLFTYHAATKRKGESFGT